MERAGTLINRLKEQFDRQEPADQLMLTAQLLLAELQPAVQPAPKSKISVVMPARTMPMAIEAEVVPTPVTAPAPVMAVPAEQGTPVFFDTTIEIPTLVHQDYTPGPVVTQPVEVNKLLAKETESLNERFREERKEVASVLQGAPIRDLKKGIGVNDRFLFVQELFRGDENMYERSLKTINAFTIYPEAEYWIQRELKVKLSWPDNSETVQLFDQLVKRRFS